ncbi:mitochondrial protein [Neoconidiobolus thromboides FSU 785]|nr:mitochondrial protein [Neoconidiobolus thromboides FSU 785]
MTSLHKKSTFELSRSVKDCLAGTVAGSFQVLAGQPFDTVKVRLQSNSISNNILPYKGVTDCIIRIFQEEGALAFYKGTLTPLLGVGLCVAIQFISLERMKRYFKKDGKDFTINELYLSGALSGLANTIVAGPVEHIRIKQQMDRGIKNQSPIQLIKHIYRHHGIKGIYHGQILTMIRDFQAYGIYFSIYELLIQSHINQNNLINRTQIPMTYVASYGILAGFGYWLSSYPIDVIKTNIQADKLGKDKKLNSAWQCANNILKEQGIKGFFKGLTPCLLRTIPAASSTFLGFEFAMKLLD